RPRSGKDGIACGPGRVAAAAQAQLDYLHRVAAGHDEVARLDPIAVPEGCDVTDLAPWSRSRPAEAVRRGFQRKVAGVAVGVGPHHVTVVGLVPGHDGEGVEARHAVG